MIRDLPVAVMDSGVGGATVLRELVRLMPEENFIFFADCANAPYGTKTTERVRELTVGNVDRLVREGIKAVVIACNTATGAAAQTLRERYDFPVIGIEPALKMAAELGGHPSVLVMATPLTFRQEKFQNLHQRFKNSEDMTLLPCPGLADIIEEGHIGDEVLSGYLDRLFEPFEGRSFDAVVLGCTHYPIIAQQISERLGGATLLDGSLGVANQTRRRLIEADIKRDTGFSGSVDIRNSAGDEKVNGFVRKYLDGSL